MELFVGGSPIAHHLTDFKTWDVHRVTSQQPSNFWWPARATRGTRLLYEQFWTRQSSAEPKLLSIFRQPLDSKKKKRHIISPFSLTPCPTFFGGIVLSYCVISLLTVNATYFIFLLSRLMMITRTHAHARTYAHARAHTHTVYTSSPWITQRPQRKWSYYKSYFRNKKMFNVFKLGTRSLSVR